MADKEATRQMPGPMVVCDAPDVCLTPAGPSMAPVPYQIVAMPAEASVTCKKVNFQGCPAMNLDSRIPMVHGDEPGVGGGVKSGVNINEAKPIDGSSTVNAEGANVLRHTSKWEMNQGNTIGTCQEPTGTSGSVSPAGKIEGANAPGEQATKLEKSWLQRAKDAAGEAAHQTGGFFKGAGEALWDMGKGVVNLGVGAAKLSPVSEAAEDLSKATGLFNYSGYSDTQKAVENTAKAVYNNPGGVWDAVKKPYTEAWAKGEYGEALGRGTVDIGSLLIPGAGEAGAAADAANVAGHVGEVGKIGEAADVVGHVGEAGKVAEGATAATDVGKVGDVGKAAEGTQAADLAKVEKPNVSEGASAGAGEDGTVVSKKTPAEELAAKEARQKELAKDPAHNNEISPKSEHEAKVGMELEERGDLKGPIQREPSGQAEFIDADGQKWDMKSFDSRWPPKKGGFALERDVGKIEGELTKGENVILDTTNLKPDHIDQLKQAVQDKGWGDKIKWYP